MKTATGPSGPDEHRKLVVGSHPTCRCLECYGYFRKRREWLEREQPADCRLKNTHEEVLNYTKLLTIKNGCVLKCIYEECLQRSRNCFYLNQSFGRPLKVHMYCVNGFENGKHILFRKYKYNVHTYRIYI